MAVYLLHFNPPYKHARHYLGYVNGGQEAVQARLDTHRRGRGARLVAVAFAAGCEIELARVWLDGDRKFERLLKKRRNVPRLCPTCRKGE